MNKTDRSDNFVSELLCHNEQQKDFYVYALHHLKFITKVFTMPKVNNKYYYLIMIYEDMNHQVVF